MTTIRCLTPIGLMASALLTSPAIADNSQLLPEASPPAKSSRALEEIIVVAEKRAASLQDVPISISALSSEALENRGISSVLDLNTVVPALNYTTTAGAASPRIRGVGTAIATGGNENAVATYVDGVYYASAPASVLSFSNISQVSVLKGPQGTLFGRNATGGLVQITTRDPIDEFEGQVRATYGNHDTYGADLYITGGVVPGIAADFALRYQDQTEGFGVNLFNGRDVNRSRDLSLRSKWQAELGADTLATVVLDYTESEHASPAMRPAPGAATPVGPFAGEKFDVNSNVQPESSVEQYGFSLDLRRDFANVELASISAYRRSEWDLRLNTDAIPIDVVSLDIVQPDRQISQELQLVSNGVGALQWVIGGYYFNARSGFDPGLVGGVIADFFSSIKTRQETESYAGFGQATYALTDQTSLTGGLRWTSEKKSIDGSGSLFIPSTNFTIPMGPYSDSETVEKLTWRLALDHKLTEDVMVYASYNRGFKSGGFDPTATGAARSFEPEELDAYEIGLKSELFDSQLRLNVAAYYYDYTDIQLNTFENSLLLIFNGDDAEVYGIDLDLSASPMEGLTISAGFSWVHGRYGDFPVTQTAATPFGVTQLPDISAKGKRLQGAPEYQASFGGDYQMPLANGSSLSFGANYSYSSRWYGTPENRHSQKPYSLVNASLAWYSDSDQSYSLRFWGRNLGDVAYARQLSTQLPIADTVDFAPGRTYGVTLGAKF